MCLVWSRADSNGQEMLVEILTCADIALKRLLMALLLQALNSLRSKHQLMDQIDTTFCSAGSASGSTTLYRTTSTFSKSRDRLPDENVRRSFCDSAPPRGQALPVGRLFLGRRHPGGGLGLAENAKLYRKAAACRPSCT